MPPHAAQLPSEHASLASRCCGPIAARPSQQSMQHQQARDTNGGRSGAEKTGWVAREEGSFVIQDDWKGTMSTDKLGRRSCDGCSRHITKAQRIHEGKEYCGTCYKREFKRAQCPSCEGTVVHHRCELEAPQCPRCDRSERRCNRCNRLAPEARHVTLVVPAPDGGSITECVVACLSCYPYFTEAMPCDICKEPSQRLSGASHLEPGCRRPVRGASISRRTPRAQGADATESWCKPRTMAASSAAAAALSSRPLMIAPSVGLRSMEPVLRAAMDAASGPGCAGKLSSSCQSSSDRGSPICTGSMESGC